MAQIMEMHGALGKITQPSNGWNKSLQSLTENALHNANLVAGSSDREAESRKSPAAKLKQQPICRARRR